MDLHLPAPDMDRNLPANGHLNPSTFTGHLPIELVVIMFGRDALLISGSMLKRALSKPPGSPFFDTTSSATFKITPTNFSKVGGFLMTSYFSRDHFRGGRTGL